MPSNAGRGHAPVLASLAGAITLITGLAGAGVASITPARALARPQSESHTAGAVHRWRVVPSPNLGTNDTLAGLAKVSASDLWAVGAYYTATPQYHQVTLTLHYDGTHWRAVASPNVSEFQNELKAVSATAANDVWAVGDAYDANTGQTQGLIEHWNGIAWEVVPSPVLPSAAPARVSAARPADPGGWTGQAMAMPATARPGTQILSARIPMGRPGGTMLRGVATLTSTNAWAVGHYYDASGQLQPLIEHWNGSAWTVSPSPAPTGANLGSVAVLSATDAWAVGDDGAGNTLALHWNGHAWTIEPAPTIRPAQGGNAGSGGQPAALASVAAITPEDVWAAGFYLDVSANFTQTLVEHWNGHVWSVYPSASVAGADNFFNAISAAGSEIIWAAGNYHTLEGPDRTLIEQRAAGSFGVTSSPNASTDENQLFGVVAEDNLSAWAVGWYHSARASDTYTLIEHYS